MERKKFIITCFSINLEIYFTSTNRFRWSWS